MQAITCNPGYGCLSCRLPARYCEYTGPQVREEEKQMLKNVGEYNKKGRPAPTGTARSKTQAKGFYNAILP